jgi:hypothetical protein
VSGWQIELESQPTMPALAWIARVRGGRVLVDHGRSVRTERAAFFEGTWVGPPDLRELPIATTVFGSGMVARGNELVAVPPSHHLECIYLVRGDDALVVSNSLTGLLVASGLDLDPRVNYSRVFLDAVKAVWLIDEPRDNGLTLRGQRFEIPTATAPISGWFVENLLIRRDLSVSVERRPREQPFTSFADYRARLTAATRLPIANGRPYHAVVALSGGYDSTAVAAVAAAAGARRAVGFSTARPIARSADEGDSGAGSAAVLGLQFTVHDRLDYLTRSDLVEADFLASGMAGEDIAFAALEPDLRRAILLHGYWGGTEFAFADRHGWQRVSPISTSGADLTEFRLRADFMNVPLPLFGAIRSLAAPSLLDRAEMGPYRLGGHYDRPIPRRLAEEAGVTRGTFALVKRAANVLPPREGLSAFTPAARESIARFAAAEGRRAEWHPRRPFSRFERAVMRSARRLRLAPLAERFERRQAGLTHFEPRLGNLLFRWSVSVVGNRYAAVRRR